MTKYIAVFLNGSIKHDARVQKTIISLCKLDFHVDLYCLDNNDSNSKLFGDGVRIVSIKNHSSIIDKILSRTFFTRQYYTFFQKFKEENKKYDYVWANDLPCLVFAYKSAQFASAKLIYDSHEIYLETINQFFPRNSNILKEFFHRLNISFMRYVGRREERKYGAKADFIITVNSSLKQHFEKIYDWDSIYVLANTPVLESSIKSRNLKKIFRLPSNAKIILYQGGLNEGRGLFHLIKSLEYLQSKYWILIFGDGLIKKELEIYAAKVGVQDRVIFAGMIPQDELLNYTAGADLGINLLETFNLSKYLASPNKLYEYVYAGIPVLCTPSPESLKILNQFEIGQTTELDAKEIAANIEDIVENFDIEPHVISMFKARYNWNSQCNPIFQELFEI